MIVKLLGWAGTILGLMVSLALVRAWRRLSASLDAQAPIERLPVAVRAREERATGTVRGVRFPARDGAQLDAWLFTPKGAHGAPIVVMAPGLGGVKEALLEPFAWRFAAQGVAALVFDHRTLGGSDGTPRHWVDPDRHVEDYGSALDYVVRELGPTGEIDASRVALWGSSLSGGTAIAVAARRPEVRALVVQCPYLGPSAAPRPQGLARAWFLGWGGLDLLRITAPIYVPMFGRPGERVVVPSVGNPPERALRERDVDAFDGAAPFWFQVRSIRGWDNRMLARGLASLDAFEPARDLPAVRCPTLLVAAREDDVIPLEAVERAHAAAAGPPHELEVYPGGHFDLYTGAVQAQSAARQALFLARHLGVTS